MFYSIVHNLIQLGIICENKYRAISGRGGARGKPAWQVSNVCLAGGGRMVEQVDDQGGGSRLTSHHGDQEDKTTKTDHENFAPRMPSRVYPSDDTSSSSSQHREVEDVPVSQPSEIFPKCVSQGSSKISILCEVLSWRRTARDRTQHYQSSHCLSFKYLPILLSLGAGLLISFSSLLPSQLG